MAKQTIDIGSSELAADGESIRSAFDKINDNFDEVYANIGGIESFSFSVGADDSALRIISTNESIQFIGGTNISTTSDAEGNITITNDFAQDFAYASLTGTPTIPTSLSELTNDSGYITGYTVTSNDVTQHQANLSITESQISDLQSYITGYTVTESDVTAHQAALTITESQISDLQSYLTSYTETNDLSASVTWANVPDANITQSSVTQHQAALSITESQVSDLGSYVESDTTGITGADQITNMVSLTQAEYDAITPNASTLYVIVG